MLESAIAPCQRQARTQPKCIPDDAYQPPFPAYCARFGASVKELVMLVVGAKPHHGQILEHDVLNPIRGHIVAECTHSPTHWIMCKFEDARGAENQAAIAYWPSSAAYDGWRATSGFETWWSSAAREHEGHGWFQEVLLPSMDRFETVFSDSQEPEGFAHMRDHMSEAIQEHVYWGSSRDRMPAAQTDALVGEPLQKDPERHTHSARTRVVSKQNLCIIRSGQDWSDSIPQERQLYLDTMHPVLTKGMNFLRDEGRSIGCYDCRFMSVVDPDTLETDRDRTFGLAFFQDLASLEAWSKEHKTHLDIFHRFLQYAQELNNQVSLRLFHEILVLKPEQHVCEYINCDAHTGIL